MLDFALAAPEGRDAIAAASDAVGLDIGARVRAGDGLFEPEFAQIAIVATTVATWQSLAAHLPEPALVAGYSVGEVSAWSCAGSWDVREVMRVVQQRARFMVSASPPDAAMMAVTALHRDALEPILQRHALHLAIEVDDDHWVLAGRRGDLEAATPDLQNVGASPHPLPVGVPSHTPLLEAAARQLRDFLAGVEGRDPSVPVLRGIDAQPLHRYSAARDALADAVARPIRWRACVDECTERGIGAALELPPGASLTRMLARHPSMQPRAVADFRSVEGVARWIERVVT
jgi:[acyl-carrier-protein] S-malonyltransferase